ncbi:uncharacterized protein E0L32_011528 [Thyridium curvatum]|uniref:O-methyltransferase C-terminal domain-containing protein n=1 Tax=Thyridium curvatum TaxID=1093900 RepID=A0A507BMQ1_9PEZI|nr:uncharacterized protein E0L32_011528 [Thyridium curvatum]TPX18779.1 hypothetical protein E0L32_011528 [Thyridium curvatum]
MCPIPPLESYAQDICAAAKLIDAYCLSSGLPYPSFGSDAPEVTLPATAPLHVLKARQKLVSSAFKIQQLATEPREFVPQLAINFQNFACIHWLCHFRVLSFIPLHGPVAYAEVSTIASVPLSQLKRIARMAMLHGFLREPSPGQVAHTPMSALLVTNPGMLDWALFMAEATAKGAARLVDATEKWGATESKTETAFNLACETDMPFFDYLAQEPDLRKKFATYMKNVTSSEGTKIDHLLNGFDWAGLGSGTVVDVGGSNCHASLALANAFPQLHVVVQDLPETIAMADNCLANATASVRNRISCQAHDFFQPQPVNGADVYLLRMILHDWADAEATQILKNLLPALAANASSRLLIMDTVLPIPEEQEDPIVEAMLRVRDLTMLQTFNSSERELSDWQHLLEEASLKEDASGGQFILHGVRRPFGSNMSILEVGVLQIASTNASSIDMAPNGYGGAISPDGTPLSVSLADTTMETF